MTTLQQNVTEANYKDFLGELTPVPQTPHMTIEKATSLTGAELYSKSVEILGEGSHDPLAVTVCIAYEVLPNVNDVLNNISEHNVPQRTMLKELTYAVTDMYELAPVKLYADTTDTRNIFIRAIITLSKDRAMNPYELIEWCVREEKDAAFEAMAKDQQATDKFVAYVHHVRACINKALVLVEW